MERRMCIYFEAEKKAGLLIACLGLVFLIVSVLLFLNADTPQWRGVSVPVFVIAIPQLIVGIVLYFRTDKQLAKLIQTLQQQPQQYTSEEIGRMEQVNRSFRIYIGISLSLFLIGLSLLFIGAAGHLPPFTLGFGGGLALQSGIMMAFDLFAEMRAALYTSALVRFKHHPDQPL